MSHRSNPQIPFFHIAILLISLFIIALLCLSSLPFPSPSPSPALTNNTVTLPPDSLSISTSPVSPISQDYLTTLSHSNALALAQSQIAASTSNILNSVIDRIPTFHLLTTYHIAPSHTLPDPSDSYINALHLVSYLAHNDPITTQQLHCYISRLSELLASGVIDSATLTLTPASTSTPNNP